MNSKAKTSKSTKDNSYIRKEKKIIHQKVSPGETQKLNFVAYKPLGEAATIVIGSDKNQIQMTIHRPIGYTTIGPDEWVLSETADIPSFLLKADHPKEKEFNESIYRKAVELAIQQGFLEKSTDGRLCFPGSHQERSVYLKFRAKYTKYHEKLTEFEKSKTEEKLETPKRPEGLPEKWAPDPLIDASELKASTYLAKQVEELHKVEKIQPYETTGGSYGTKRQRPIVGSKGKRLVEVVEMATSQLFRMTADPPNGDTQSYHGQREYHAGISVPRSSDTEHKSVSVDSLVPNPKGKGTTRSSS
jgi:hypothetical protein